MENLEATTKVIIICTIIVLSLYAIWKIPIKQLRNKRLGSRYKRLELTNEYRKTIVQLVGGFLVVGSLLLTWYGMLNDKELAKEQLVTDQFIKASKMLGDSSIAVRMAGIYSLEQIMNNYPNYHKQVVDLLSAYIREKRKLTGSDLRKIYEYISSYHLKRELISKDKYFKPIETDIQSVLDVLSRRKRIDSTFVINLTFSNLYSASFNNYNFENIDFSASYLGFADFSNSNFKNVVFKESVLDFADFSDANFKNVVFEKSVLPNTEFFNFVADSLSIIRSVTDGIRMQNSEIKNSSFKNFCFESNGFYNTKFNGSKLYECEIIVNNIDNLSMRHFLCNIFFADSIIYTSVRKYSPDPLPPTGYVPNRQFSQMFLNMDVYRKDTIKLKQTIKSIIEQMYHEKYDGDTLIPPIIN